MARDSAGRVGSAHATSRCSGCGRARGGTQNALARKSYDHHHQKTKQSGRFDPCPPDASCPAVDALARRFARIADSSRLPGIASVPTPYSE
jgi:hypothetical protein